MARSPDAGLALVRRDFHRNGWAGDRSEMFYKPNFCCCCGEKIKRAEWKFLTSRRFCEVCAVENQGQEWLVRGMLGACLLFGLFGIGSVIATVEQPQPVSYLPVAAGTSHQSAARETQAATLVPVPPAAPTLNEGSLQLRGGPEPGPAIATKEQLRQRAGASDEAVYYCGALTRKGTPCSRRVKTKGRCWQHEGRPSASEEEKPAAEIY